MGYAIGDRVTVKITGVMVTDDDKKKSQTCAVSEDTLTPEQKNLLRTRTGKEPAAPAYTHKLYMGNAEARQELGLPTGRTHPVKGDIITASFSGTVTTVPPYYGSEVPPPDEICVISDGPRGYYHYLDSRSATITREGAKPKPEEKENAVTARITSTDDVITSAAVIARIRALQERTVTSYQITRNRDGQRLGVLLRFSTSEQAALYLDNADLNPERFRIVAVPGRLEPDDAAELARLTVLDKEGAIAFGSRWNGRTGVELRPANFYDSSWARKEAVLELNLEESDTDRWPLRLIPWYNAARERLAENYECVYYDRRAYYGENS